MLARLRRAFAQARPAANSATISFCTGGRHHVLLSISRLQQPDNWPAGYYRRLHFVVLQQPTISSVVYNLASACNQCIELLQALGCTLELQATIKRLISTPTWVQAQARMGKT